MVCKNEKKFIYEGRKFGMIDSWLNIYDGKREERKWDFKPVSRLRNNLKRELNIKDKIICPFFDDILNWCKEQAIYDEFCHCLMKIVFTGLDLVIKSVYFIFYPI